MAELMREAVLIARKDLLIEWRTRVAVNQIAPLGLLVLVIFAFALDANQALLDRASAGLFWVAVLFAGMMTVQRAFTLESSNGIRDALRLSGIRPTAVFLGKLAAISVQLLVLEAVLLVGIIAMYDATIEEVGLAFLFAPAYHPAMRYAVGPRRELATRTVFNVLGPLTNPAPTTHQLVGVFSVDLLEFMADVLKVMVFHR